MRCSAPAGGQDGTGRFRLALVAMPWAIFNRPSIQLGVLKAHLRRQQAWLHVQNFHPYLTVAGRLGHSLYQRISGNVWLCEALYAPLFFLGRHREAARLFEQERRRAGLARQPGFNGLIELLDAELAGLCEALAAGSFNLVGFSVCFNQLFASLATARRLKQAVPDLLVVFGGSSCPASLAKALLATEVVDFVVSGEGEEKLAGLCSFLAGRTETLPAGVYGRRPQKPLPSVEAGSQLASLGELATPDYDDYFSELSRSPGEDFKPVLPVEFSRGCWWRKCAFCNLNLQWRGYRAKSARQMAAEVSELAERHGCLDFIFADNALPARGTVDFFNAIDKSGRDLSFFAEVRADLRGEKLVACRQGGLTTIQVGVEALSDSLLKRLDKGTTLLDNIMVMRDAVAAGVVLEGNLIIEFPGSTQEEVEETLRNLEFVLPFHPLSRAAFFLGLGSPVESDPASFGVRAITDHPRVARLFPGEGSGELPFLIKGYRGDRGIQRKRWRPVTEKLRQWRDFHRSRNCKAAERPPLSYRDGANFLVLRQEQPARPVLHHTLRGTSRAIYLACRETSHIDDLAARFSKVSASALRTFLDDLVQKRLLFAHEGRYLALAVRDRRGRE